MKIDIRACFLNACVCFLLGSTTPVFAKEKVVRSASQDELQSWIGKNAVSVRSVDPADENFKDLEFLIDVIGDAQVVQLGEASHSVGNGFAAKARLAKFLYQRMGFDVLVWEEGIYGMRLIQTGLRGSEDVLAVAQLGIRKGWSDSEEVMPLFEYAKASL